MSIEGKEIRTLPLLVLWVSIPTCKVGNCGQPCSRTVGHLGLISLDILRGDPSLSPPILPLDFIFETESVDPKKVTGNTLLSCETLKY